MNKELSRDIELAMHRFMGNANWWTVSDFLHRLFDDGIHGDGVIDAIVTILDKWVKSEQVDRRLIRNPNTGMEYHVYRLTSNVET